MSNVSADLRGLIVTCEHCGQKNRLPYERLDRLPRCGKCSRDLSHPAAPIEPETDEEFEALLSRSALPVLSDFWAAWCGPCKMIAPEVAKVAAQGKSRWIVAKVNTEILTSSAKRFAVSSIPLLVLFRNGREVARQAGAMPASAIQHFIEKNL
jgi:thioredoxin 2